MKSHYFLLLLCIIFSLNFNLYAQDLEVTSGGPSLDDPIKSNVKIVGSSADVIAMWNDDKPFRLEFYTDGMKLIKKIELPKKYNDSKIYFKNSTQINGNIYVFYSTQPNKKCKNLIIYAQKVNIENQSLNEDMILIGNYPFKGKLIDPSIYIRKSKNDEHLLVFYNLKKVNVKKQTDSLTEYPSFPFVFNVFNSNMELEWKKTTPMPSTRAHGIMSTFLYNTKVRNDGKVFYTDFHLLGSADSNLYTAGEYAEKENGYDEFIKETNGIYFIGRITCLSKDDEAVTINAGISKGNNYQVVFDFDDSLNIYLGGVESIQSIPDRKIFCLFAYHSNNNSRASELEYIDFYEPTDIQGMFSDSSTSLVSIAYIKKLDKNMKNKMYVKKLLIDTIEMMNMNKKLYQITAKNKKNLRVSQNPIRMMPIKLLVGSDNRVSMITTQYTHVNITQSAINPGGPSVNVPEKYMIFGNIIIINTDSSDSTLKSVNIKREPLAEYVPNYRTCSGRYKSGYVGFSYYPIRNVSFNMINNNVIIVGNNGDEYTSTRRNSKYYSKYYSVEKTKPFIMIIDNKGRLHKGLESYLNPDEHINVKSAYESEMYGFDYTLHNNSLYYRNYNSPNNLTRIRIK